MKYREDVPLGGWTGGEKITPVCKDEVIEWLERVGEHSALERLFPDSVRDA